MEQPITIKEAAEYLRVHEKTLFRWMRTGKISQVTHRIGGRVFMYRSELEQFIKAN